MSEVKRHVSRSSGYRQRRRALEKARRRRRASRRLAVLGLILVLAGAGWGFLSLTGGSSEEGLGAALDGGAPGLVLAEIRQAEEISVVVLLGSSAQPTFVLGLPADTLLEGPEGFEPLGELLRSHDYQELGFETLLSAEPTAAVTVAWERVLEVLPARGGEDGEPWPEILEANAASADTAAQAVAALVALAATEEAIDVEALADGDAAAFAETLRSLAPAPEVTALLPGEEVEGTGYEYYEPDLTALRRLLGLDAGEAAIEVEVQNGSGEAGIAQRVGEALAPLGYTMLEPKNAEQFPNVEATQILAARDVLSEADRIRQTLGLGQVVPRDDLPAGRIVVVVGKDLSADSLPGS